MNATESIAYFRSIGGCLQLIGCHWSLRWKDERIEAVEFKRLEQLWLWWKRRFARELTLRAVEKVIDRTTISGESVELAEVEAWRSGTQERLPKPVQDEVDILLIIGVDLPQSWRSAAAKMAIELPQS